MAKVLDLLVLIIITFAVLKCGKSVQMPGGTRNWEYSFLSLYTNSTNKDLLDVELHLERVGRGDYAVSGYVDVKTELNDDFYIFMESYRSKSGSGEFFKLPFSFENQTINQFFDTSYRNFVMSSMKNCSNLPQIVGPWKGPMPQGRYWMEMCLFNADDWPILYVTEGFYKARFYLQSLEVNCLIEVLMKFDTK